MARRILSGEWITKDLVLEGPEVTTTLSGPSSISGTLEPGFNRYLMADKMRPLADWATMVYALDDSGTFIASGLVLPPSSYGTDGVSVTCAGVSAYPQGYIYTGNKLWGPQIGLKQIKNSKGKVTQAAQPYMPHPDPIAIYRDLWAWLQAQPYSNLGVTVTGDTSTRNSEPYSVEINGKIYSVPTSPVGIATNEEPYRLRYFDTPDVGAEMNSLAEITPFDYVERTRWADSAQTIPKHEIEIGFPRLGKRREDLRFAMGENIPIPPVVETPDGSADVIIGVGNGDPGPSMAMFTTTFPNKGRLRRHRVYTDKTQQQLGLALAMGSLRGMMNEEVVITSVAVVEHPNAPLSSIQLGDDIRVLAWHPDYGDIDVWVRVLGITRGEVDGNLVLSTTNASFFKYHSREGSLS